MEKQKYKRGKRFEALRYRIYDVTDYIGLHKKSFVFIVILSIIALGLFNEVTLLANRSHKVVCSYSRADDKMEGHYFHFKSEVRVFVEATPREAPYQIVKAFKGASSRILRSEFPNLLKLPSLWTHSYFVRTAGHVSAETIK